MTETPAPRLHAGQREKTGPFFQTAAAAFAIGLMLAAVGGFFSVRAALCDVKPVPAERMNPNTATTPALMRLPGIGRVRAMDIVKARAEQAFDNPAELERIRGIGPKTVEKIEPYLIFEDRGQKSESRR